MSFAVWKARVRYKVIKPRAPKPKREAYLTSGGKLVIVGTTTLAQDRETDIWRSD